MRRRLRESLRDRRFPPPSLKVGAREFADALEENEEHMAEMAAMAVTCEQFGISEERGYDLLIGLSQESRP